LSRERSVFAQHVAGQIKRPGDQNSRRWIKTKLARRIKRLSEIVTACRRNTDSARDVRHCFRRHTFFGTGHRHCNQSSCKAGKISQKTFALLTGEHAAHQYQRSRYALLKVRQRRRYGAAAVRIVPTVEPPLAAGWSQGDKP